MNEQKVFHGQPKVWWSISNKKSPIFGWLVTGCLLEHTYRTVYQIQTPLKAGFFSKVEGENSPYYGNPHNKEAQVCLTWEDLTAHF